MEWLSIAFALFVFGLFFGAVRATSRRKKPMKPVPDGPDTEPYAVYTTDYDLELRATELNLRLMSASPDYARGWLKLGKASWRRQVEMADQLVDEHRESFFEACGAERIPPDSAVTLLIEQSGSMEGESMRWVAAACRLAAEALEGRGCQVEILGFSTVGWQGGFAYERWKATGRPKRPGRLCATLHIVYKALSDETFDRESWEAMLNPNILRENVDGEALAWAAARLGRQTARNKHLILLSDGASIDDATAMHNGLGYLDRHLRSVIDSVESDPALNLTAIEIGHTVDEYYSGAAVVEHPAMLPAELAGQLRRIGSEVPIPVL